MIPICELRGWTRAQVNMGPFIGNIVGLVSMFIFGTLVMRVGPRILMTAGAVVSGTAFILLGQVDTPLHFYLLFVLLFFGNGAMAGIVGNTAVNNWFVLKRGRALGLATEAVEAEPKEGANWGVLGQAHYRSGEYQAAVEALARSIELDYERKARSWFFLAMAHWQLDRKDEARRWYDKAVEWMDKNKPEDKELRRFRAEAAELLGITEAPAEKPEEEEKADQPTTDESGATGEEAADAPAGQDSPPSAEP